MDRSDISGITRQACLTAAARVGRPARINAQAIIRAALEIGLDRVTLKQVADHLDVAISTLYRHVRNRDELVRLAASRRASLRELPESANGHWAETAFRHAESLFESLMDEPQLISELMRGRLGPDVEVDFLEDFLRLIVLHGFTPAEGVRLYRAIGMLAIGAAVATAAMDTVQLTDVPQDVAIRRVLAERREEELPLLRKALPEYCNLDSHTWLEAVHDLLAGIALARGETLPPNIGRFIGRKPRKSTSARKSGQRRNPDAVGAAAPASRKRRKHA